MMYRNRETKTCGVTGLTFISDGYANGYATSNCFGACAKINKTSELFVDQCLETGICALNIGANLATSPSS